MQKMDVNETLNKFKDKTFIRYRLYGKSVYRYVTKECIGILITERENYVSGKLEYRLLIQVDPGNSIYNIELKNFKIDRIKYIELDDYLMDEGLR